MASISRDPGGRKRILFVAPDEKRKAIRLGKVPQRAAEAIKVKVESLIASKVSGCPWDNETAQWVGNLPDELADRLAKVGLISKRERGTLGDFLDSYIEKRIDVKDDTKVVWGHTKRNLLAFFGESKALREVTPGDAEDFRLYLVGQVPSATTIHKRIQVSRMFFRAAVKRGVIDSNPFQDVKAPAGDASHRFFFVTREMTDRALATCPDYEWRLIVALCRYGGLRCPSEVLSLRWNCIDWERQRIKVISPKTAHHPNRGSRVIPMFPELVPYLREAFEQATDGAVHPITRYRDGVDTPAGWRNINLRTQFGRILDRAGLDAWPRMFHALRASRETELVQEYPVQCVSEWLGNTPRVALKHYLMVTEEHFQKAVSGGTEAAQKAAQYLHESGRTGREPQKKTPAIPEEYEGVRHCTNVQVAGTGFEPVTSRL